MEHPMQYEKGTGRSTGEAIPETGNRQTQWKRRCISMSYIDGGMYDVQPCPICGSILWNGKCENPDCHYHWYSKDDDDDEKTEDES